MQCFSPPEGTAVKAQLVLAHGAGAGSQSDFMQQVGGLLAAAGITTWLFDFPYMQTMMNENKRRPPDRLPKLISSYQQVLKVIGKAAEYDPRLGLFLGGKSMGGRVATHLLTSEWLDSLNSVTIKGAVVMGYPFTPPGKQVLRTEHFDDIQRPLFIAQGERDTFGGRDLIQELALPELIATCILEDGDHSLKPRKSSGLTHQRNLQIMVDKIQEWICQIPN